MREVDRQLFYSINRWPDSLSPFMEFMSGAMGHLWVRVVLAILIVAMIARGAKSRKAILLALASVALANTITDVLKGAIPLHRPFQELPLNLLAHSPPHPDTYVSMGTASAHSANMAAVATAMTMLLRGWGVPWIVIAVLTGLSRIYVGVHYPSQVLLGWLCGVFAAFVVIKTWELIVTRRNSVVTNGDGTADG